MVTYDTNQAAASFLKEHTAAQHEALEEVVNPRLQALKTVADYTHLLKQFYGYFKPVQDGIMTLLNETDLPDLAQRRTTDLILQDLTFSNAHNTALPLATQLPHLQTKAAALGALYVLEGSTLGGRGITKILLKNTHLNLSEQHVQFFNGYGAATGAMWRSFTERLNTYGNTPAVLQQMAQAANETFGFFKLWLLSHEQSTKP